MAGRVKVADVDVCQTEDFGPLSEEGYRTYVRVYGVVVRTKDDPRTSFVYPLAFRDEDEAAGLAGRVRAKGDIDPDLWWDATPPEVPEWATEEFAWRERNGWPL